MSKTTATLFIILLIFIGILLFIQFAFKQSQIFNSLTQSTITPTVSPGTSLSLSTATPSAQNGQTVNVAVLIHNPNPHPAIAQIELSYDPMAVTIDTISPGTFFTNPHIALQNIDPNDGRISYALRCPTDPTTNKTTDCTNTASATLATITMTVNPYTIQNTTALSFLPRSVIRTHTGNDTLHQTTGLQLAITKPLYPIASYSATASQGATPVH